MAYKAGYIGKQNILDAFDTLRPKENAYFSVWYGSEMAYGYNGQDFDEGRDLLEKMLTVGQNMKSRDVMDIKFHPDLDNGFITNKSKTIGKMRVIAYDPQEDDGEETVLVNGIQQIKPNDVPNAVWYKLLAIEEKMKGPSVEDRVKALEDGKGQVAGTDNMFFQLLQQPGMADTLGAIAAPLVGAITDLIRNFMAKPAGVVPAQGNIILNGHEGNSAQTQQTAHQTSNQDQTPKAQPVQSDGGQGAAPTDTGGEYTNAENDAMDNAITSLSKYCDPAKYLPLLAKFADNDPAMFSMLLSQLDKLQ